MARQQGLQNSSHPPYINANAQYQVFARVIEGDRHQQRRVGHDAYRSAPTGTVYLNGSKLSKEDLTPLPAIIEKAPNDFSERDYLSIFTLSKMLDQGSANAHLASALLLHLSCLRHLSLAQRRVQSVQLSGQEHETHLKKFITDFSTVAKDVLNDPSWNNLMREYEIECDIQDVIDGRLLRAILCLLDKNSLTSVEGGPILEDFEQLARTLHSLHTVKLSLDAIATSEGKPLHGVDADAVSNGVAKDAGILPFSNPVFDKHLASIHIMVDEAASTSFQKPMPIISREISHWHNAKRSLDPKKATAVDPTKKVSKWWNPSRSNQFYMRDMTTYSASLTNTKGKTLTPETITLSTGKVSASAAGGKEQKGKKDLTGNEQKGKQIAGAKETKGKKETSAGGSKADKIVAENKAKKDKVESTRTLAAWDTVRRPLDKLDPESRFLEASAYLHRLEPSKTGILQLEVEMYCLQALLQRWAIYCRDGHKDEGYRIGALIWDILRRLGPTRTDMTKAATSHLQKVCSLIGLPQPEPPSRLLDRPLSFDFVYPLAGAKVLSLDLSPREFQLLHCGPYMDRNTDARPDPRVSSFQPDGWQRKVLDELDANHSIFVVAPTSAGKTFISFYAMEKVLRESNDGVLVYVAPTKALVNQIAAEILGRFSKNYPHAGTSVWAIHTRDYRINNPSGCQILVTVPHILQIVSLVVSKSIY